MEKNKFPAYLKILSDYSSLINTETSNFLSQLSITPELHEMLLYTLFPGRRLRSSFFLLLQEQLSTESVNKAIGIEMLHRASLVVDDVMDNDDLRRGLTTFHKKYSLSDSIIVSHYLCSYALKLINDHNSINIYAKMCEGQCQEYYNDLNEIALKRYIYIAKNKTASLFSYSFEIASKSLGNDLSTNAKYSKLGENIGILFQIGNDIIDTLYQADSDRKLDKSNYSYANSFPVAWLLNKNKLSPQKNYLNTEIRTLWKSLKPEERSEFDNYVINLQDDIDYSFLPPKQRDVLHTIISEMLNKIFWTHRYQKISESLTTPVNKIIRNTKSNS